MNKWKRIKDFITRKKAEPIEDGITSWPQRNAGSANNLWWHVKDATPNLPKQRRKKA